MTLVAFGEVATQVRHLPWGSVGPGVRFPRSHSGRREADVEAMRYLVRAREDGRADSMRVRHRLSKLLLRQGRVYCRRADLDRGAPTEYSSGACRVQGSITTAGNAHVRRLLVAVSCTWS